MADWNRDPEEHMNGAEEEEEGIISQEDCWSVIQSYFDENVSPFFGDVRCTNDSHWCKHK